MVVIPPKAEVDLEH